MHRIGTAARTRSSDTVDPIRVLIAIGLDLVAIMLFVTIGRRNHDEGGASVEIVKTALPFVVGLGIAWIATRAWRRPTALLSGLAVWPVTVLVGLIARRTMFNGGTAASFVIVTTVFLGASLVGWRAASNRIERRRERRDAQSSGALRLK